MQGGISMLMDRENTGYRSVYKSYVIDDGWKKVPEVIIEEISFRVQREWNYAYKLVCKEHRKHRGDWLTQEVAEKYEAKSWVYRVLNDNQYTGMVRQIGEELQAKYGVTELEAINILNGRNVADYVQKYFRIQHRIPLHIDLQEVFNTVVGEIGYEHLEDFEVVM